MHATLDADYLVVGAGAMGMAFTDALIDHADVKVALVDRRHGAGGHWLADYPFVRLHQASAFYGAASTVLGGGRLQTSGPEAGLSERADQATVCAYYADLLAGRFSGSVTFHPGCDYVGERTFVSRISGRTYSVPADCRVVDARYLAPDIPAELPPKFAVSPEARVVPINDLVRLEEAPSQYVVVGSGKTATDAIVWLLARGVDPDAVCWVRPREPWMLNRAVVQPDPAVFLGMVATMMEAATRAASLDSLFLDLEAAGIMLRVDPALRPTMARTPTLGTWELELLRSIENVVRLGHLVSVARGRLELSGGSVSIAPDAVVVNCAAEGLKHPPLVPIWGPDAITLQPVRAGFPCFGAALAGYVEATRSSDEERNALCRPSPYPNSLEEWARMNIVGIQNAAVFGAEPDVAEWAGRCALNPSRVAPDHPGSPALDDARGRLGQYAGPGLARLSEMVV